MMSLTYKKLLKHSKTTHTLNSIQYLLEWDQETQMPSDGIQHRIEQISTLASTLHKHKTKPIFKKNLLQLISLEDGKMKDLSLSFQEQAVVKEWRRQYLQNKKIPSSFVQKFSSLTAASQHVWAEAKKNDDFKTFSPYLTKIIDMNKKKADLLGFVEHPYDALINDFEPGMTLSQLLKLFSIIKDPILKLLKTHAHKKLEAPFQGLFESSEQLKFSETILHSMGFHQRNSRLDLSAHPCFVPISLLDNRLTTTIQNDNPLACILAVLHEGGHALYNMGLPASLYGTPICEHASLGIDESQSRFWEIWMGHSLPFWKHFYPKLQQHFSKQLSKVPLNDFYAYLNRIEPSLIRIQADPVSYNLHILMRLELEVELLEGKLKVTDLPEAWNSKSLDYLGLKPKNNQEGCLQDIHWSMGALGYFPTYTLGNLYASQFFHAFHQENINWEKRLEEGDLAFISNWLMENIHQKGKMYSPEDLCLVVSKEPLNPSYYLKDLKKNY